MIWKVPAITMAMALTALAADSGRAAKVAPSEEGITRQQAEAMLGELREIRLLLEKQAKGIVAAPSVPVPPPPALVTLKTGDDWQMLGDKNAPYTMVEYIDFQCPFCARYDSGTFAEIRKNLIDTGKLRYFSRNFPLDFHPNANKAAIAASCAADQGKFWRMREVLVTNANNLAADVLPGLALTAGLDGPSFKTCLDGGKHDQDVRSTVKEGASVGVQGTPSFILGKTTSEGVTGTLVVGALPYENFDAELKKLDKK